MLCEKLRVCLNKVQDLPRIMGPLNLPVTGVGDMVQLRESLKPIQDLPKLLDELKSPLLKKIAENFNPLKFILDFLNEKLLIDPSLKLREGGFIADGVSNELDKLRDISENSKKYLNEMLTEERERTGISSLKVSYNKIFGYFLEVNNVHIKSVPENYIRKQTLVNAERYITPQLKEF